MDRLELNDGIVLTGPMPYALVTSLDIGGRPNAMGASWVTRVSFNPFLMMVSIGHERYSHKGIEHHRELVICYPSAEQENGALYCGRRSGSQEDKLARSGLKTVPSLIVKPPTIQDYTVAFECRVVDAVEAGDHTLFVGEVVAATGAKDKGKHLFLTSNMKGLALDHRGTKV